MKQISLIIALFFCITIDAKNIDIFFNKESTEILFAVEELKNSLKQKGEYPSTYSIQEFKNSTPTQSRIVIVSLQEKKIRDILSKARIKNEKDIKKEGFVIHNANNGTIYVLGFDNAGAMYGGLELAEIIVTKGIEKVENQLQNPYMKVRGTKFNIPLDVRTPTYSDPSDVAQMNMREMWNFDFWKEYIDNLARYRYNLVSLWNEHPFPSMVKVPDYPEVALDDVRKSTVKWKETLSLSGLGFDAPDIINNYEIIKKISIDEKINFWRKVMTYGKSRNINFYIVTWNIFVYGTDGKYGITDKLENPITVDYFRKSVKEMLLTYPDLAGIGLTTGENMYDYSAIQKEEWAFSTYGQGVLDALKENPKRKIDFIHRQHQAKASDVTKIFKPLIDNKFINFVFSFKYAQAHVYSATEQPFHEEFIADIMSEQIKTLWTLRNDDIYYFRWGAPDFVREFIKNIPYNMTEGYYFGSDQYVWGRDILTKNSALPLDIEIVKHWYQWMCWGRLGYNPTMGNDRFINIIQNHFPTVDAEAMFKAWQSASMIYPLVTGFHWLPLDFQWYIEGAKSQPFVVKTPSGYSDLNSFINIPPHKKSGNMSIPHYVKAYIKNTEMNAITPLQLANRIIQETNYALEWANKQSLNISQELRFTIEDIKSMAWLGRHYAHKIMAATYMELYRETSEKSWHIKAIEQLNLSVGYMRHYAAIGLSNYKNPLWTNRVGIVDWKDAFKYALYEIFVQNGKVSLPSMQPTAGGTILEAEDIELDNTLKFSKIKGYTGSGYVTYQHEQPEANMTWSYEAPAAGRYILEFRYTLKREECTPSIVELNGTPISEIEFWSTGNEGAWQWERITANLAKGANHIRLYGSRFVCVDHLNIIPIQ